MNRFGVELRAQVNGDTLAGRAVVFSSIAKLRGHYEAVARSAFDTALERGDDVKALFNHDPSLVLGSSKAKTLRLEVDDEGVSFEVDLPDTGYARDLRELIGRNDISGMSFGFMPDKDEWSRAPDGGQLRTHTQFRRFLDVSPVAYPAYDGTDVYLRAADFSDVPLPTAKGQLIRLRAAQLLKEVR